MERISKKNYIAKSNAEIKMYQSFNKAIDVILPLIPIFNNKKMDKRFITKINNILSEKVPEVIIAFDTNFKNERDNRFILIYDRRYIEDNNVTIDYYSAQNKIYATEGKDYIDKTDFKLIASTLQNELVNLVKNNCQRINERFEAIEKADYAIETISKLNEIIKDTLKTIPERLRPYNCLITCPIYNDEK